MASVAVAAPKARWAALNFDNGKLLGMVQGIDIILSMSIPLGSAQTDCDIVWGGTTRLGQEAKARLPQFLHCRAVAAM